MTLRLLVLCIALFPTLAAQAANVSAGDRVLARYDGGPAWFAGIVESVQGDQVAVNYDDGDRDTRPAAEVKPFDWAEGQTVECNWEGSMLWKAGVIQELDQNRLVMIHDGDTRIIVPLAFCRSK